MQKAASFQDASDDLRELAHVPLAPSYLQKLSLRIGKEWKDLQDADVQAFRDGGVPPGAVATAKVAVGAILPRQASCFSASWLFEDNRFSLLAIRCTTLLV